jgi:predicted permease
MMTFVNSLRNDCRHAVRMWCDLPGVSLAIVTSLTLSIGAVTAIFTLFDVLLLRPLPVGAPDELHAVGPASATNLNLTPQYFSYEFFKHVTTTDPAFQDMFASSVTVSSGVQLSGAGVVERLRAELVSGNYFRVLGVPAAVGRTIGEDDDRSPGAHAVTVLSDAAWQRAFGGRIDIVGQTIQLNGSPYTVIGVAAKEFFGTRVGFTPDLWIPLSMTSRVAGDLKPSRDSNYIELMFRLTGHMERVAVETALTTAYRQWKAASPSFDPVPPSQQPELRLVPAGRGLSLLRGQYGQPLVILLAAVAILLMIACTNIAGLLTAHGISRRREIAIRLSQGATETRIMRQLLTESFLLSLTGGALGWAAAIIMGRGVLSFLPGGASTWHFSPDIRVLAFTMTVVTLATLGFGLVPARNAGRLDVNAALRGAPGDRGPRFRTFDVHSALSALQVSLSIVLVMASFLFAQTLHRIRSTQTGFQPEHVLIAALDPVRSGYSDVRTRLFYDELLTRLAARPGVRSTGLASHGSLSGVMPPGTRFMSTSMHADADGPNAMAPRIYVNIVTPGYFEAVDLPLRRGRGFTGHDVSNSPRVVIVNETAARQLFGNADPIGRRIGQGSVGPTELEVVGLVGDAKYLNLREAAQAIVYRPYAQGFYSLMTLHVRTTGDPVDIIPVVQREVGALDNSLPLFNVQTLRSRMDESLRQERLVATVAGAVCALGTGLALIGVYAVANYGVTRRKRDLAIRIALGASARDIVFAGLACGIPLALVSTTLYRAFLHGVSHSDPAMIAMLAGAVALLCLAAGYLPARRAARIDPLMALRSE